MIELKSERVQSPQSIAGAAQTELPSVVRLTVNPVKRVVADVWWMSVVVARAQTRKETLAASAREATSQMHAAFKAYQDAASSLRSFIVSVLGRRSEKLLRYGIRPVGKRSRQKAVLVC